MFINIIIDFIVHIFLLFVCYFYRDVFPLGVPQQFSFIATFCSKIITRTLWHLVRITDYQNNTNLQITLNQAEGTIEFSIVNYDGYLQTITFEVSNVSSLKHLI